MSPLPQTFTQLVSEGGQRRSQHGTAGVGRLSMARRRSGHVGDATSSYRPRRPTQRSGVTYPRCSPLLFSAAKTARRKDLPRHFAQNDALMFWPDNT